MKGPHLSTSSQVLHLTSLIDFYLGTISPLPHLDMWHIGALCCVLNAVQRVEFVKFVHHPLHLGGHDANPGICCRHEPVLELGGKATGVEGDLLISGM